MSSKLDSSSRSACCLHLSSLELLKEAMLPRQELISRERPVFSGLCSVIFVEHISLLANPLLKQWVKAEPLVRRGGHVSKMNPSAVKSFYDQICLLTTSSAAIVSP